MKTLQKYLFLLPILLVVLACSAIKKTPNAKVKNNWFPLSVGNHWIYADSIWRNNILIKTSIDTVTIINTFYFHGIKAYHFSDKTSFYYKNDTVFQIYKDEFDKEQSTIAFLRIKKANYPYSISDDEAKIRTVKEMKDYFLYVDNCESKTIIKPFVGIKESIIQNCNVPNIVKRKKSLLNYQLQN